MTAPRELPDAARERSWWMLWERLLHDPTDTPVAREQPTPDPAPPLEADQASVDTAHD